MHLKLIKFLLKLKAPRIVYVSCNPATCARDLDYLCHGSVLINPLSSVPFSGVCSRLLNELNCIFAGGAEYKRMLQIEECPTCRHVPSHPTHWMCLLTGSQWLIVDTFCIDHHEGSSFYISFRSYKLPLDPFFFTPLILFICCSLILMCRAISHIDKAPKHPPCSICCYL